MPRLMKSTSGGSALSGYGTGGGSALASAYQSQGAGKKPAGAKPPLGAPVKSAREEMDERLVRQAVANEKRRIMKAMEQQQEKQEVPSDRK